MSPTVGCIPTIALLPVWRKPLTVRLRHRCSDRHPASYTILLKHSVLFAAQCLCMFLVNLNNWHRVKKTHTHTHTQKAFYSVYFWRHCNQPTKLQSNNYKQLLLEHHQRNNNNNNSNNSSSISNTATIILYLQPFAAKHLL